MCGSLQSPAVRKAENCQKDKTESEWSMWVKKKKVNLLKSITCPALPALNMMSSASV